MSGYQRGKRFSTYEASVDVEQSQFQLLTPVLSELPHSRRRKENPDRTKIIQSDESSRTAGSGPPLLPLPSRRSESKAQTVNEVQSANSPCLSSSSQKIRFGPGVRKIIARTGRLTRAFGFVDRSCSVSDISEINAIATLTVDMPLLWSSIYRNPFPLLRSSLRVQCQLTNERCALLGRSGIRHHGVGKSSMVMRSQDRSFAEFLGFSSTRGGSRSSASRSSASRSFEIEGGSSVAVQPSPVNEQRGLTPAAAPGRDWLHSGYENLTGPPPKWRQSSLFRMGREIDFYFIEPCKNYYVNENLRDFDPVQTDLDLSTRVYWSESEIAMFITRYIVTPKDFRRIAQTMATSFGQKASGAPELARGCNVSRRDCRGKTEAHCAVCGAGLEVQFTYSYSSQDFYYRFKYFFELKRTIRELKPGKLTLKNRLMRPKKPTTRNKAVDRVRVHTIWKSFILLTRFNYNV